MKVVLAALGIQGVKKDYIGCYPNQTIDDLLDQDEANYA